jgi:hypothetical protein
MIYEVEPHVPVFEDIPPTGYPSHPERPEADLIWRVEQFTGETPRIVYGAAGTHPLPSLDIANALVRVLSSLLAGTLPGEIAEHGRPE